jgi:hypothetical protein
MIYQNSDVNGPFSLEVEARTLDPHLPEADANECGMNESSKGL